MVIPLKAAIRMIINSGLGYIVSFAITRDYF